MREPKGQVAVELAIVLPLALLFLFVLFELCLLFNARQVALLSAFRAARSFVAEKNHAHASACALKTLGPVVFRAAPDDVAFVEVGQENEKIRARVFLLHKPLFPVFSLVRLLGRKDLPQDIVRAKNWSGKTASHIPITVDVELFE